MNGGYQNLIVWEKSMELAQQVYRLTETFPTAEQYGITSQMRRAAVSIPSNIAEGSKRGTIKDFKNFLRTALGSLAELETQIALSRSFGFGKSSAYQAIDGLCVEVSKMLTAMIIKGHLSCD